jgi:hypothetical protein
MTCHGVPVTRVRMPTTGKRGESGAGLRLVGVPDARGPRDPFRHVVVARAKRRERRLAKLSTRPAYRCSAGSTPSPSWQASVDAPEGSGLARRASAQPDPSVLLWLQSCCDTASMSY